MGCVKDSEPYILKDLCNSNTYESENDLSLNKVGHLTRSKIRSFKSNLEYQFFNYVI